MAAAAHRTDLPFICGYCLAFSTSREKPFEVACSNGCLTYYCSTECSEADAAASHLAMCQPLKAVARDKSLKREVASLVRLLFSLLSRCSKAAGAAGAAGGAVGAVGAGSAAAAAAAALPSPLEGETDGAGTAVSVSTEEEEDALLASVGGAVPWCTLDDVLMMMEDDGSVKRFTKRKKERAAAVRVLCSTYSLSTTVLLYYCAAYESY